MRNEKRRQRILREYVEMHIPPWAIAPSEIDSDDEPCPYPAGSEQAKYWAIALEQHREINAADPHYFDGDSSKDWK